MLPEKAWLRLPFTWKAGWPGPLWISSLARLPRVQAKYVPPPVPGTCSKAGVALTAIWVAACTDPVAARKTTATTACNR